MHEMNAKPSMPKKQGSLYVGLGMLGNIFLPDFFLISAGSQLVDPGRVGPVVLGRPEQ